MCCGKKMTAWFPRGGAAPRGYDYKEVTVKCGNTRPGGYPYLCDECEERHANAFWYEEAAANDERIDPLD